MVVRNNLPWWERGNLSQEAIEAAVKTRHDAGFDDMAPLSIYELCRSLRVQVRFVDVNMEGMYHKGKIPRIYISALRPKVRQTYTCAHELGHHIFGHSSTVDQLKEDLETNGAYSPQEFLADTFAAHLLMPALGIRYAFASRGLKMMELSPLDIYKVACDFGVGYSTLITHLWLGLEDISKSHAEKLKRSSPKYLRHTLIGQDAPDQLHLLDATSMTDAIETSVGGGILLPFGSTSDANSLIQNGEYETGALFCITKPGVWPVNIAGREPTLQINASKKNFSGLAQYRTLGDSHG